VKHILKLQSIEDPLLRANYVRKFKIELAKEITPPAPSKAPTVTQALVSELKDFMAKTAISQRELSSLLGCSQQLVCDLLSGHRNLSAQRALSLSRLLCSSALTSGDNSTVLLAKDSITL
jgi:predicted XRE-type DNA-binding protein